MNPWEEDYEVIDSEPTEQADAMPWEKDWEEDLQIANKSDRPDVGALEAARYGAEEGFTFGLSRKATDLSRTPEERKERLERERVASEEHPWAYYGSMFGAPIAAAIATGGGSLAASAGGAAARAGAKSILKGAAGGVGGAMAKTASKVLPSTAGKGALKKAAIYGAEGGLVGAQAVALQSAINAWDVADETKTWEEGVKNAEEIIDNAPLTVLLGGALGSAASLGASGIEWGVNFVKNKLGTKVANKIAKGVTINKELIDLLGGEQNILNGQRAYQEAIAAGATPEEALTSNWKAILSNLSPTQISELGKIIKTNPELASLVKKQITAVKGALKTAGIELSDEEAAKYSSEIIKQAFGGDDIFNASNVDTSEHGINRILGKTGTEEAAARTNELYQQGLREANASWGEGAKGMAAEIGNTAIGEGAANQIDSVTKNMGVDSLPSLRKGTPKRARLEDDIQKRIYAEQQASLQTTGKPLDFSEITNIENDVINRYVKNEFLRIMREGADNPYELDAIKEALRHRMGTDIVKGSPGLGRYYENANSVLENMSDTYKKANASYTIKEPLLKARAEGEKFFSGKPSSNQKIADTLSSANPGLAAAKKAAFKLGVLERARRAAAEGDHDTVLNIVNSIKTKKPGHIGHLYTPEEVAAIEKHLSTVAQASKNAVSLLGSMEGASANTKSGMVASATRFVWGTLNGSPNTTTNALISLLQKADLGPDQVKALELFAKKPNDANFVLLNKSAKDALMKKKLSNAFKEFIQGTMLEESIAGTAFEQAGQTRGE